MGLPPVMQSRLAESKSNTMNFRLEELDWTVGAHFTDINPSTARSCKALPARVHAMITLLKGVAWDRTCAKGYKELESRFFLLRVSEVPTNLNCLLI